MFETSKWIWHKNLTGENITCNFRTCFQAQAGTEGRLAVSAQHFFRVFVNGVEVGGLSSPAPSVFTKRMRYLEYDISPFLQKGENVLAFTVLYLGGEGPVSYTHLDVYKRQAWRYSPASVFLRSRCNIVWN